jgi:hypothetical protein
MSIYNILFSLLIGGLQEASCVSTLQGNIVCSRCFTFFRLVWDPGIILSFNLVQFVDHRVVMALLEEKQSLGREDCNVPIFGFPCSVVGDDLMGLCQLDQRGDLMLPMKAQGV